MTVGGNEDRLAKLEQLLGSVLQAVVTGKAQVPQPLLGQLRGAFDQKAVGNGGTPKRIPSRSNSEPQKSKRNSSVSTPRQVTRCATPRRIEMLYEAGLLKMGERKKKEISTLEQEALTHCTFTPTVSSGTKRIDRHTRSRMEKVPYWERMGGKAASSRLEARFSSLRDTQLKKEVKDCTHHPVIHTSPRLPRTTDQPGSVFDQLGKLDTDTANSAAVRIQAIARGRITRAKLESAIDRLYNDADVRRSKLSEKRQQQRTSLSFTPQLNRRSGSSERHSSTPRRRATSPNSSLHQATPPQQEAKIIRSSRPPVPPLASPTPSHSDPNFNPEEARERRAAAEQARKQKRAEEEAKKAAVEAKRKEDELRKKKRVEEEAKKVAEEAKKKKQSEEEARLKKEAAVKEAERIASEEAAKAEEREKQELQNSSEPKLQPAVDGPTFIHAGEPYQETLVADLDAQEVADEKAKKRREEEEEIERQQQEEAARQRAAAEAERRQHEAAQLAEEEAARAKEELANKQKEEAAKKAAEEARAAEEAEKLRLEEEARQRAAEEQAAKERAAAEEQKAASEQAAKQRAEEEASRQKAEAEAAAKEQAEKDQKAAEEARQKALEDEAAKQKLAEEEEAAKQASEEAAARQKAEEESARQKAEEEAARQKAEEEAARQKAEEAARQKAEEESARQKAEEEAARQKAEEDAARQKAEEEAARQKAEEEAARQKAEEDARQKAAEEVAAKEKAEADAKAEEEAAKKKAAEERAAEEAAKKIEEDSAMDMVKQMADRKKADDARRARLLDQERKERERRAKLKKEEEERKEREAKALEEREKDEDEILKLMRESYAHADQLEECNDEESEARTNVEDEFRKTRLQLRSEELKSRKGAQSIVLAASQIKYRAISQSGVVLQQDIIDHCRKFEADYRFFFKRDNQWSAFMGLWTSMETSVSEHEFSKLWDTAIGIPEDPMESPPTLQVSEASTTKSKAMSFVGKLFNKSSPTTPRQDGSDTSPFESPRESRPLGASRKKPLLQSTATSSPTIRTPTSENGSVSEEPSSPPEERERSRSYLDSGRRRSRSRSSSPSLKLPQGVVLERIRHIYVKTEKKSERQVELLLQQYSGKEHVLYDTLCRRHSMSFD
eukprot:TRINITY_DN9701_c0_g3_i1.p1 TRINITY_DN9701_c0_g3~~TRINITY_DN9701_c0_g3_i1.p1  ORF type:complete len:1130 (+),score=356.53 TRINITY_DN9701_c0_g3_i1:138-3527(+)